MWQETKLERWAGPGQTSLDFAGCGFLSHRAWSKGVTFKLCVEKVLMSLQNVNLREKRPSPKTVYCMTRFMCNVQNPLCEIARQTQRDRK